MRNLHAYQFGCARRIRDFVPSAVNVVFVFDLEKDVFLFARVNGRTVLRIQPFVMVLGVTLSDRAVCIVAVGVIRKDLK